MSEFFPSPISYPFVHNFCWMESKSSDHVAEFKRVGQIRLALFELNVLH